MRYIALMILLIAGPAQATDIAVPSGRIMSLYDVVMEPALARFRFTLAGVGAEVAFEDVVNDFEYLCARVAMPALEQATQPVDAIVISVSATQVAFGETTDTLQFFQPFVISDGQCEWDEIYD